MESDRLSLNHMVFFGRHGANPEETVLGQRFGADLTVCLDLSAAARTDDLIDTVSYAALYKAVRRVVEGEPSRLIEHVAGRALAAVLSSDPRIARARITITKLSPPLEGSTTVEAAVTLERERGWIPRETP